MAYTSCARRVVYGRFLLSSVSSHVPRVPGDRGPGSGWERSEEGWMKEGVQGAVTPSVRWHRGGGGMIMYDLVWGLSHLHSQDNTHHIF